MLNCPAQEISPEERARRQKRNRKRKLDRQKAAEGRALPPVVGLGRREFLAMLGFEKKQMKLVFETLEG